MAQKITPNLWFDQKAKEAAEFYVSVFPKSEITDTSYYPNSSEEGLADFQQNLAGKELTVQFKLAGYDFVAINAGSEFQPTPASSFMVNFDPSKDKQAREHLDQIWEKLMDGGTALMPLEKYDFSEHYGWVQDKYGYSWQLILTNPDGDDRPFIIPALMFGNGVQNKASEAINYYLSVFNDSKKGAAYSYGQATGPAMADSLMFADFVLENQWFVANDSGVEQDFTFNEAVSYSIACSDQAEIDYYWEKLSADPENEQCGWCKDKYGVSWQVVPENIEELMKKPGAYKTMMDQKKIIIDQYKIDSKLPDSGGEKK